MSGSFESVRQNACALTLDLGLYSHLKEFWEMESETMLNPTEKKSTEAQWRYKPETPHHAGQGAQLITD